MTRIDPQIAQRIRALTMKYEEALNEHDAEAAAAFFTEDAVWTTPQGTFYGRSAIEQGSQITIFIGGISRTRSLLSIG